MDTLSKVSEYLNNLEAFLDDGDSLEAQKVKVGKSEKELEMFEALEHKSVVVESEKHRVVVFTKASPRAFSKSFMRIDYGDYGRKTVMEVCVEIHGFVFLVDFVVIGYANKGEMRIDLTMLEEERDLDDLLVELVETMEEVGSSSGELVKMGKASRNKGHYLNKLTPPPPLKIEEISPLSSIAL
ncbi:hypothetical protein Tco_0184829 [Tanacetum coccineum]